MDRSVPQNKTETSILTAVGVRPHRYEQGNAPHYVESAMSSYRAVRAGLTIEEALLQKERTYITVLDPHARLELSGVHDVKSACRTVVHGKMDAPRRRASEGSLVQGVHQAPCTLLARGIPS